MRQVIRFESNRPETVALEFPDGVNVPGQYGPQVRFSLTENRLMYVDSEVAQAIRTLGVEPGQPFTICKRWEKGRKVWWEVEKVKSASGASEAIRVAGLSPTPAKSPVIESSPVSASVRSIPCSLPVSDSTSLTSNANGESGSNSSANAGRGSQSQPIQPVPARREAQTETNRPIPITPPNGSYRTPPVKPSYEEAFRECLRIVTAGLAQTGEQWSDGAKQAMVSTLMIQLGRENRLGEFQPQIGKVA